MTVDEVSSFAALAALGLTLGWAGVVLTAHLLADLPGALGALAGRVSESLTPRFLRSALAAVVGLGLGATPAVATEEPLPVLDRVSAAQLAGAETDPAPGSTARAETASAPDPNADGVVPNGSALPEPANAVDQSRHADPQPYVVQRGDTLWGIAAAHLPATAGATEIDRSWREWWQSNREVVGADPNLIRPGQTLSHPESMFQE